MNLLYLNSDILGGNNQELGEKLIANFLKTINDSSLKIDAVFCVNSGIKLVTQNNETINLLNIMEQKGTVISSCGTCLDFFNLRNELKVGDIGSMKLLVSLLNTADKIIRP